MKLSVKSDYAVRAILELATRAEGGRAHRVEDLATAVGTSANYLVQILLNLKGAGLVQSVRGKQGGYRLSKAPDEISLGAVLRAVEGEVFDAPALSDANCPPALREAWGQLRDGANAAADTIHFGRLAEVHARGQEMYHI
ncbi:MAG: transcriptional regulator, BadM/Rrf2 family protein [Verrucomicrobiales bacterium]|nr:transcriptional regulator, BadM/Rrf2 family protein [Verrucomicrobiales bacterium]